MSSTEKVEETKILLEGFYLEVLFGALMPYIVVSPRLFFINLIMVRC